MRDKCGEKTKQEQKRIKNKSGGNQATSRGTKSSRKRIQRRRN
jgi:hypothetical protein